MHAVTHAECLTCLGGDKQRDAVNTAIASTDQKSYVILPRSQGSRRHTIVEMDAETQHSGARAQKRILVRLHITRAPSPEHVDGALLLPRAPMVYREIDGDATAAGSNHAFCPKHLHHHVYLGVVTLLWRARHNEPSTGCDAPLLYSFFKLTFMQCGRGIAQ